MRLAIVSGGSRGLGLSLCRALHARGDHVLELSRSAPHPFSVRADLADPAAAADAVAAALVPLAPQAWDEIVVISNAGMLSPIGPTSRQDRDAVVGNINTNITSAILLLTQTIAAFQPHRCRKVIANISSGAATKPYAGWSLYCAAKAGLEHFIRAVALEQAAETFPFVPVNINPNVMDTAMQTEIRGSTKSDFPDIERFVKRHESGELRDPAKVAVAVLRILALPDLAAGGRYDVDAHT